MTYNDCSALFLTYWLFLQENKITTSKHNKTNSDVKSVVMDESLPYDSDLPVRWCIYTFLGWFVGEGAPLIFKSFGI